MSATQHEDYFRTFRVEVEPQRDVVRVCPCGEVDLATVGVLGERIDELLSAGFTRLLIDLRQLTFLDSKGIRLLLELARSSEADGWELAVIDGPREVQRVFDMTGLRPLLPFVDSYFAAGSWRPPRAA